MSIPLRFNQGLSPDRREPDTDKCPYGCGVTRCNLGKHNMAWIDKGQRLTDQPTSIATPVRCVIEQFH